MRRIAARMEGPKDYFERRAAQETKAADEAQDVRAAEMHRELARRYDEKAKATAS